MKTILNIRRISTTLAAATAVVGLLLSAALAGAGPALHHASGGGNFFAAVGSDCDIEFNEFMVTVKAHQLPKGRVKGQFEFHNLTKTSSLYMKIIHVEFLGDATVGLIGEVTKSVESNAKIGDCRAIKLQDNGEGKNAEQDQASKLFNCNKGEVDWGDLALKTLNSGNIQVR